MLANNPLFLVNLFFNLHVFFCKAMFADNGIKTVFSAEHSFCVSQIIKPPFEALSQSGTFETKSAILGFPCARWNPYFCSIWWFCMVTKKYHFPRTDSCNEKCAFSTFRKQTVFAYFSQSHFCVKRKLLSPTTEKTLFLLFFLCNVPFPCFSYFLFFFLQHEKDKNQKRTFFPFLDTRQPAKKTFSHPYTPCVILRYPKNTVKLVKDSKNKSWTNFWPNLGPSFDSKKLNFGPSLDSTTYICVYML